MPKIPLLQIDDLVKHFPLGKRFLTKAKNWIKAVDGVTLDVSHGEVFGLVGESGCGKTTLGRLILRLIEPSSGQIKFKGQNIFALNSNELNSLRQRMQIIFQDPYSSLDPRMKIYSIVTEPLRANQSLTRSQQKEAALEVLNKVGLKAADLNKYPHEFSGGQRQRIGIARSLCVRPELIVADEPVSALDVSIQAQVINLMVDLKDEFNLSYVFISHDLSVVEHICDRIAVMYLGTIVEQAATRDFSRAPRHPYTRALLQAVPLPDPRRKVKYIAMEGDVPNPINPPNGCAFNPRCPYRFDRCSLEKPFLKESAPGHFVACWLNQGLGMKIDE